jgi:hypothetical protein
MLRTRHIRRACLDRTGNPDQLRHLRTVFKLKKSHTFAPDLYNNKNY